MHDHNVVLQHCKKKGTNLVGVGGRPGNEAWANPPFLLWRSGMETSMTAATILPQYEYIFACGKLIVIFSSREILSQSACHTTHFVTMNNQ